MENWLTPRRLDDLYDLLKQRLSPRRVRHILGSAETAVHLALRWGVDAREALAAALLHDIGKEEDREAQRLRIEKSEGGLAPEDREFPGVWHAVAGAIIARDDLQMTNEDVLRAIRIHPTGDRDMSRLDEIVFLSDYLEPTRTFEGVDDLRRLAMEDIDAAVDAAVMKKTYHLASRGKPLHQRSVRLLHQAEERMERRARSGEGDALAASE